MGGKMSEKQIQSDECFKQHEVLKKSFEELKGEFDNLIKNCVEMRCFFFGGTSQTDGHLSFVDKVNIMFQNQENNRKILISFIGIFTPLFVSGLVSLSIQIHTIRQTSEDLLNVINNQKNIQEQQHSQQIEIEKIKLQIKEGYK